jgi:hypothetical protein
MADFEELKLTVNLVDNASAGLANIRTQLTQLTQTAGQVQTAFAGVATGAQQAGTAVQGVTPHAQNLSNSLKGVEKSAEETGRGLLQMALSARSGAGAFPQLALGAREAFTGLQGLKGALAAISPEAELAVAAIGAVTIGVTGIVVAATAGGFALNSFARDMSKVNDTAKAMGVTFADLKSAIDFADRFDVAAEVVIRNLNGIAQAQANLGQNNSSLRSRLRSMGFDRDTLNALQLEQDPAKFENRLRDYGKSVEKNLLNTGRYTAAGARAVVNQMVGEFGQDSGFMDRKNREPQSQEEKDRLNRIGEQSAKVAEIWGDIRKDMGEIGHILADWGLPLLLVPLRLIKGLFDGIAWVVNKINDGLSSLGATMRILFPGLALLHDLYKWKYGGGGDESKKTQPGGAPTSGGGASRTPIPGAEKVNFTGANDNVHPMFQNASFGNPGADVTGRAGIPGASAVNRGNAPNGSDTGPATGGRAPGAVGDPAVPSHILDQAKAVALHSGPGGVEAFMRDQGYPKAGNWCGEFAASVVKSAGGTPPQNPQIASNWRGYGSPVEGAPQPGDIAVRKGVRTGGLGSHVTFVENFDPKTGRFTGVGGNQGHPESSFKASQYEFRRAGKVDLGNVAESAGVAGAAGGPGTGAVGEGGAEYLRQQRSPLTQQLEKDPQLKRQLAALATLEHESDPTAVVESLYNRTTALNEKRAKEGKPPLSLRQMMYGGFYGPAGQIPGRLSQLERDPARMQKALQGIDAASSSNLLKGATDQGSGNDPNVYWPGGKIVRGGETYNDWGGGAGHEGNRRFREGQQAAIAAADRAALDRSALSRPQEINSTGSLNVAVSAPAGTKVDYSGENLLKPTKMQRSVTMPQTPSGPTMSDTVQQYMAGRG